MLIGDLTLTFFSRSCILPRFYFQCLPLPGFGFASSIPCEALASVSSDGNAPETNFVCLTVFMPLPILWGCLGRLVG